MAKYIIQIPANYRRRVGGNASVTVEASSPAEARKQVVQTGVPAAVIGTPVPMLKDVPDYGAYPPDVSQYIVDPAQNPLYAGNIGGFTNFANTLGTGYDPTGGGYSAGTRGGETVPYIGGPPRPYGGEGESAYGGTDAYMPYDPSIYTPTPQDIAIAEANAAAEALIADPQEQVPPFLRSQQPTTDMYMPYDPSIRPRSYGSGMDLGGIVSPEEAEARLRDAGFVSGMSKEAGATAPVFSGSGMANDGTYDPLGGASSSYSIGSDPYFYGDAYTPPSPKAAVVPYDPLGAAGGTIGIDPEARGIDIDELDRREAERAAQEVREKLTQERIKNEAKQAALLTGPVRSWDAKLADIRVDGQGRVTLPVDMWKNSGPRVSKADPIYAQGGQEIGKEQIEAAIRKIAEFGIGGDTLNKSVEDMLRQARAYYSDTPRGRNTWDKNIDGGLIPEEEGGTGRESILNSMDWKATWGDIASGVSAPKAAAIESSGAGETGSDRPVFDPEADAAERAAIAKEVAARGAAEAAADAANAAAAAAADVGALDAADMLTGTAGDINGAFDPTGTTSPAAPGGAVDSMQELLGIDPMGSASPASGGGTVTGTGTGNGAGTATDFDVVAGAMQGFPPPSAAPPAPAAGTVGVPAWSSQDMIDDEQGFLTGAGQRLAFRNVFGEPATGVGPLASYLQRQTNPLTQAYRAQTFADMGREEAGKYVLAPDAYPKVSFENFLTSVRDQPTGLGGAYGQALQNVDYLRGLGGSQVPTALAGVFNPEQAANTRDARALLQAAQRGKYSGLVSRSFRRPTEDDLFSDYVLSRQDASTAGTAPQNFLNFAASRYGL